MNKSKQGKLIRMIGVCGLALGALTASGTVASIVQLGDAQSRVAVVNADTVSDDTTERVLNLHKYKAENNTMGTGATATGTDADAASVADLKPMAGVQFEIYKLGNSTDAKAFAEKTDAEKDDYTGGTLVDTLTTDADGNAKFIAGANTDADGYYLVKELDNPAVKTKATPFIVHLPMTVNQGTGSATLKYTVDVYPKNEVDETSLSTNPNKTFAGGEKSTSVKAGDKVIWDLTANRPADAKSADGKYAKQFVFSDPIDTKSLTLNEETITMAIETTDKDGNASSIALEKDTDFTIDTSVTKGNYTVLQLALTDAGLIKLGEAADGSQIVAKIETIVNKTNDAQILNTFDTYYTGTTTDEPGHETTVPDPKDPVDPTDPKDPTIPTDPDPDDPNQPTVYMGNVDVTKVTEANNPLKNATFKLAEVNDDGSRGDWVTDINGDDLVATTGEDGKAEFTGLLVDPTSHEKEYFLIETDAPVGYDVDGKLHKVTATQDTESDVTVTDPDNAIPNLPLTGAQGRILILAVASVTLLGSGSYMILRKRREAND
ncbi:SpaH/EbpB family LPXTG-anchored major pilin [Lacticaseibacillus suibinensis]|uniref:SpaH/EbpB family LPXTG-anchored major pilin n=1 Tax=Lacticaseibacillus suibinensis TaxID=2486011 RepID=UPI000F78B927|nr:SpaH/EbpB family LPXTG-anchored major pilin [Lacticaseibacillus suibinensis]